MTGLEVIEQLGFNRAERISPKGESLLVSMSDDCYEFRTFGVDSVYFNVDENGIRFPSVFLKKVEQFDSIALIEIAEIHQKIWNFKKVLFLYVYSDTEIRIYNCSEKPIVKKDNTIDSQLESDMRRLEIGSYSTTDNDNLAELELLFSRIAIDTGIIWTIEEAISVRNKIKIQRRVDKYLVSSLVSTAKELRSQGLEINFIHKIILRSLFLLYLEDRGATDAKFYGSIKKNAKSYFDILENVDATYALYEKLEFHFNGNVFTVEKDEKITVAQLSLIKRCFIIGHEDQSQLNLFEDWRLFDFSIIQVELLSEIYENFLVETDANLKKQTGTYYTPPSLVEFILNDKLPVGDFNQNYGVKILDPSCGSGIFLVESFKRLVKRYENKHNGKLTDFNILKKILTDNIYGVELNPQAIKVAAFSLYLALVNKLNPKSIWQSRSHQLPNLINDPNDPLIKEQGRNLFLRDTIQYNEGIDSVEFDLVVGNPPFGTKNLLPSIINYCEEQLFAKEMVLPFLHKATKLAPSGEIALIFNTKVLTNTGGTYQNFRRWLFNECYVEKVFNFSILRKAPKNYGGQLFGDATGPISIVYYQKEIPNITSDRIAYYAPKTFIKSNVLDGLSLDFTDLKYLPREECQKPDTKIWKVAMWGGLADWELIQSYLKGGNNLQDYLTEFDIKASVGLQPITKVSANKIVDDEISSMKFIRPERIERYYTKESSYSHINTLLKRPKTIETYLEVYSVSSVEELPAINVFRRTTGKPLFKAPLLLLKEGFTNNKICVSLVDHAVAYNSTVLGMMSEDKEKLRFLSSLLNSEFATYFLLLISNSWGIERERLKPNEIYNFPIAHDNKLVAKLLAKHKAIENKLQSNFIDVDITLHEQAINELVLKLYNIEGANAQLISDFIYYNVDLFYNRGKSIALRPVLREQTKIYADLISSELNDFLDGQGMFANSTFYRIERQSPLMMIKISFSEINEEISESNESVEKSLKVLDKQLWEKKAVNIYFRKKLNYKSENDIYIIRPNQKRFWSKSMAIEDASELILEILTEK